LALLSLLYIGKGMRILVSAPDPLGDFHSRWLEVHYLLAGRNPNDAYLASDERSALRRPLWSPRETSTLPAYGPPGQGVYPPWALAIGVLFCGPEGMRPARLYFAGLNAAALAALFLLGHRTGIKHGRAAGWLLGLSGLAMSANCTTLGLGQYGIIVTGLLILCLWSLERERPVLAGWWLGLASVKPILSAPFGLTFLMPLRPKALAAVAGVLLVASGVAWWLSGASPPEMLLQTTRSGTTFAEGAYGPMNALHSLGLPVPVAQLFVAIVSLAGAVILLLRYKTAPPLVQFAIVSLAARFWSYHQVYDNLILIFLLVAFGELAVRQPSPRLNTLFLLLGVSLWAPGKCCDWLPFQLFQTTIWMVALAVLLARTPAAPPKVSP
jgi:hypothetical protein